MSGRRRGLTSIRARLTVATAVVATVVLALLAVVTAVQIRDAAASAATQLAADDLRPYVTDLQHQPDETPDLPASGLLVLVEAPGGAVQRSSMPAALAAAARRVVDDGDVRVGSDEFRIVTRTVSTPAGVWRLWAARDLTASDAVLNGVLMTVLIGAPLAVLVTALTAWLVASAALRPVERLRSTAERLRTTASTDALPTEGAGELAELGATLNGLIAELRASAAHERRVTADAAHELRTPLAVLAAQTEIAERHPERADLPGIRASVDRMSRLADGLLALSRADSGAEVRSGRSPVAQLVTAAMEEVDRSRLLAPPGVLVDLELVDGLVEDVSVAIDPVGFGRIVANLVGNALAAGPDGAVTVRLGTDRQVLVLEVEDDGPGVPEAFLPYAFDRFARPEGSRSSGSAGAGLGLALVKALADRAGGTAALRNRTGTGAIATVRLPLTSAPAS